MNSQAKKMTALTVGFYGVAAATVSILEKISPSGPCTPGLGVLAFFLSVPVALILFCINAYRVVMGETEHTGSLIVHGVVILGVMLFLKLS